MSRFGLVAFALAMSATTAAAFVEDGREWTYTGRAARAHRAIDSTIPARATAAFAPLAADGWTAIWDRDTGVPLRLWGGSVAAPGATRDPAAAERVARGFVAAHVELLAPGSTPADLELVANDLDGELRTVGFRQTWRGLPVVGGQLGVVISHDRIVAVGSEALPDVTAVLPAAIPAPKLDAWLGGPVAIRANRRVVLPIVHGAGDIDYRVADALDVEAIGDVGRWEVFAGTAGPIARRDRLRRATATLLFNAGVRYPTGPRADQPAPFGDLTADGVATTTLADASFAWAGTAAATVVPSVVGTFVHVVNEAGPLVTATLTAQPGQPLPWNLATDELADAQLSAYVYGNIAKTRARRINPAIAAWLDQPLGFHVNENSSCNAFSSGDDVHFFKASAVCENTGRLADIVFHEFGHSLHDHSIIPGMGAFESSLSEGLADFNAANLVEDPQIGRGLDFTDAPVRDIDPFGHERVWPDDASSDPHITGLIISGALWDLRKLLAIEVGHDAAVAITERVFAGVMQRAADIPSSYTAALLADDDDGDLGNGTPHGCEIRQAFGRHGLVPGFRTTAVGPPVATGLALAVPVTIPTGTGCLEPRVTQLTAHWQAGDASGDVTFEPQGADWTATLPGQPAGTTITYAITALLDNGNAIALPDNPADPQYQLFVGEVTPLACETFDADPHWIAGGTLANRWEWGVPGVPGSGDPTAAHTGTHVLGTDVTHDGVYDDNATVYIDMPAVDVRGFDRVHLQYWRWLTVDDGRFDQAQIAANGAMLWQNALGVDHVDKEWRFHDVDLTPQVGGGSATVRWTLVSDTGGARGGWNLDDVCIVGFAAHGSCGDGRLDPGEQCDDGNPDDGDGCSAACTLEANDGGGCCSARTSGKGSIFLAVIVIALRRRRSIV